ncbi:sulfite exporter TauE/SafE family protein [Halobacillus yeomjeoni]|uniref:Sulfite exporter TauE/SafE family protein n=1 Tax=Halobacillus yeomjeoni TaxID=311194 RepID=A0A931HTP3_9BACI|nr:sulfite exporter TauE/SafE family protein [Halobacillus yeomjeoni]MBH0229174.1 sulfite exporter TauE/SafE family protein [Halobacillus yeomjeoni]
MYQWFNQISSFFSEPFFNLANQWESIPIIFALLLGIVGSAAPCQMTGNIGAITLYGNSSLQKDIPWKHVFSFVAGKIVVFSLLGLAVWAVGNEIEKSFTQVIPWMRKLIGPFIILMGIYLAGIIKLSGMLRLGTISEKYFENYKWGSFLMGVSFTLAFCPTMFVLFFMTLMPVVFSSGYGAVLPAVFGIGTSLPLLLIVFLFWYLGLGGSVVRRSRKIGGIVQKVAGWVLIIIGVLDTLTYWI